MASATRRQRIPKPPRLDILPSIPFKTPEVPPEDTARYRKAWPNIDFDSTDLPEKPQEPESVFDIPPIPRAAARLRYALMKAGYILRDGQPDKKYINEKQLELKLDYSHPIKVVGAKVLIRVVEYPNLEGQKLHGYWNEQAPSEEPELPLGWSVSELGAPAVSSAVTVGEPVDGSVTNTPLAA